MLVSICCLVYNHEKYLRDALEGFVKQQTDFDFEVIVHDDASTDHSAEIIREYAEKYPKLIKPIFQKENQHSKRVKISFVYVYPATKGKYIALCEGDDYWIDPLKLQKQVDYMETHPSCRLCFTNGFTEKDGVRVNRVIPGMEWNRKAYRPGNADYNLGEMALLDAIPTASLVFYRDDILNKPKMPEGAFTGDSFYRLYTSSLGYAHCIDEDTCVYREGVSGSLTTQWMADDQQMANFAQRSILMVKEINRLTNFRYNAQLEESIFRRESIMYSRLGEKKKAWQKKYRKLYWDCGLYEYFKYFLQVWFPRFRRLYKKGKAYYRSLKKKGNNP